MRMGRWREGVVPDADGKVRGKEANLLWTRSCEGRSCT